MIAIGTVPVAVPLLHDRVLITLYQKPYAAIYSLQPFATGTAVLLVTLVTAACLGAAPRVVAGAAAASLGQLRLPGLTVSLIVGLAYLYNYSGMAYTLGAAASTLGTAFPIASAYLGWVGCFLSGSDTASNLLFGNLQVAAAHQLQISPVLLAATNSSGGAIGKMISPQNIAVGVTTVGLVGAEGRLLRATFWHSVLLAALIGALAWVQAVLDAVDDSLTLRSMLSKTSDPPQVGHPRNRCPRRRAKGRRSGLSAPVRTSLRRSRSTNDRPRGGASHARRSPPGAPQHAQAAGIHRRRRPHPRVRHRRQRQHLLARQRPVPAAAAGEGPARARDGHAARASIINVPYGHSFPDYLDYRKSVTTLTNLVAYTPTPVHLSAAGQTPERTWVEVVSPNYFALARRRRRPSASCCSQARASRRGPRPTVVLA